MSDKVEVSLRLDAEHIAKRLKDDDAKEIRLMGYRPKIELNYVCPYCWVLHERRSTLDPIPTGTKDDALTCDTCGSDFLVDR